MSHLVAPAVVDLRSPSGEGHEEGAATAHPLNRANLARRRGNVVGRQSQPSPRDGRFVGGGWLRALRPAYWRGAGI